MSELSNSFDLSVKILLYALADVVNSAGPLEDGTDCKVPVDRLHRAKLALRQFKDGEYSSEAVCQACERSLDPPPEEEEEEEDEKGDTAWSRYTELSERIDARVAQACKDAGHKKVRVDYSAYKTDKDDMPIDNLDQVAVEGKVILVGHADDFFGGSKSKDYRSDILENPTWLQVAVCANKMIKRTRDTHHCFLEGLTRIGEEDGIQVYEFFMGS